MADDNDMNEGEEEETESGDEGAEGDAEGLTKPGTEQQGD